MLSGILLLLGSAIVGSLVFGWIARAFGGARSRKARATLGEALDRVPEGGGAVILRGQLVVRGSPCRRFEDDRKAAAATASVLQAEGAPVEANARAEALALLVGGLSVQIEGPLRVIAGSREASVGGKVAPLRARVLDRIGAVDPEVAWALCHRPSEVRLRSLADGDRVRIAGVLRRAEGAIEGAAHGYRDAGAPWCLVPEEAGDSPALRAAFEGAPHGPREQRAAIAGAVLGPAVALTIAVMMLPPLPPPIAPAIVEPSATSADGDGRDHRFDGTVNALEDGDLARASAEMPATSAFGRYAAELHLLAGRFEAAATALDGELLIKHADPTKPCLVAALRARGRGPEAAAALAYLRRTAVGNAPARELSGSEGRKWAACALLLADSDPGRRARRDPRRSPAHGSRRPEPPARAAGSGGRPGTPGGALSRRQAAVPRCAASPHAVPARRRAVERPPHGRRPACPRDGEVQAVPLRGGGACRARALRAGRRRPRPDGVGGRAHGPRLPRPCGFS
ncbi:MAG: hypothetical protein QM820_23255 [Minicystis sp.]